MIVTDFEFDFCALKSEVPQYRQIDGFTMWVQQYHPSARFRYPKRPGQRRIYRAFHHGNWHPNPHPYTAVAVVTVDTSRYSGDVEAMLETCAPTGMNMVSTITNNELRRRDGWDEDQIEQTHAMFRDGDTCPRKLVKWSAISPGGIRLRSIVWEHDPLELAVNWILESRNGWEPWVPDHPYFTDPSYERVPF